MTDTVHGQPPTTDPTLGLTVQLLTLRDALSIGFSAEPADLGQVALARVIATQGFGGRRDGEVMVVRLHPDPTPGADPVQVSGSLASGAANQAVRDACINLIEASSHSADARPATQISVPVGDQAAVSAGLACGGTLTVLIQLLTCFDSAVVRAVADGSDLVVMTDVETGASSAVVRGANSTFADDDPLVALHRSASRLLDKGPLVAGPAEAAGRTWFLDPVVSTPHVVILGHAALATAIASVASSLGWTATVREDQGSDIDAARTEVVALRACDGLVVLSHDVSVSSETLGLAIRAGCGYVGALGSTHTQAARATWLQDHGFRSEEVAVIRGPVGLDLGARTPEETALAIVAEMLSVTRGRNAQPLVLRGRRDGSSTNR